MTAFTFSLLALESGELAGTAVLCAGARYMSIRWSGVERIDRRFATVAEWRAVDLEIRLGIPPGPLPRVSTIHTLLTRDAPRELVVQYLSQEPVDAAPHEMVAALDARLGQVRT